ncbi:ubiquinone/menaquinone biosynthesis C-methylase UbiE [Paenibacillus forsythiae]|uniref:Ubiquinone/menaquinone biosynthesis C-methylase UbiE n=1 Tax=Paenibacillus forsythiae TaxID=365616 RepID=A0ABU3H8B2_9BACL|nr:methyltransferase domain-containing protein [Paenibacillus forsythiae]MDT3427062.1 ubiquinone/menaquinone biosynthesis C-methylase UbiE [Paenibacillus forsythiae]
MTVHLTFDNENLAKAYDEISNSQFNNGTLLVEKLEVKPGQSILDIGSGTGRLGRHINELIGDTGSFLGIDPLEERVKIANDKNRHGNTVYRIGVAEDLGFIPDSSIDIIYLNAVFHWVIDKEQALREIYRVLKPGGKVGFATGARELNSITGLQHITNKVLSEGLYKQAVNFAESTQHQHGLTATSLVQLLAGSGLKVREVQIKEIERQYGSAQEITRFFEASSFGNYLNHVPDALRPQAKSDIEAELEKHRSGDGWLKFSSYTIFAIAQKSLSIAA